MTEEIKMTEVVSVKFRNQGKIYFFDPQDIPMQKGERVVVETSKGLDIGSVIQGNHEVDANRLVRPLRPVIRKADPEDLHTEEMCRQREREAYAICKQKIKDHGLDMKLVDVECSFEGNKILFFFSSEGRVDFRELVKDLAGVFRTRIELRQIGVRDEARMLGGLGICGRPFCCSSFMEDFQPVSTKMAKTQSMSLNPTKISGSCGRLMCCLRYEQPAYEELVKNVPKNGTFVETPDGYGSVVQVNVLRQNVRVKLDGPEDDSIKLYDAEDVAVVPGGRPRDGAAPPHVLVVKPKKKKMPEEGEADAWEMPDMLIASPTELARRTERGRRSSSANSRGGQEKPSVPARTGQGSSGSSQKSRSKSRKKSTSSSHAERIVEEKSGKQPGNSGQRPKEQSHKQVQPGGEKGSKKYYNNRRRNYRPRPKTGNGSDDSRKEKEGD